MTEQEKVSMDDKRKKSFFVGILLVFFILLYLNFSSSDNQEGAEISRSETVESTRVSEVFLGKNILVGKWMGSNKSCLNNYNLESTQVFTIGQGYIQLSGKKNEQAYEYLKGISDDVKLEILGYLANCSIVTDEDSNWFTLTLKRPAGDKLFYWYGDADDELPEVAEGHLFSVSLNGIVAYEKFDLAKIEASKH